MTPLAQARRLRALGFSVIPVPRPRPGITDGKRPTIKWKAYQTRLASDSELVRWFCGAPMNLAIVTGQISGVVVIDADSPAALAWIKQNLNYTPWQTKTSKGFHLYYRHPGRHVGNRVKITTPDGKLALDVRGDGGFVIAAGSVHGAGHRYIEAGDWTQPRSRVPPFWPAWIARPMSARHDTRRRLVARGGVVTTRSFTLERARRYLAEIPRPEIGSGSDQAVLSQAARLVRGFRLSTADAEALLWAWAGNRPGWTREWIVEKVRNAERYGTEALGAYL